MRCASEPRVGYVVKRYPRYSETFIVNEILAHERAGLRIDIFSLRQPNDTHFQDLISRVRASVTYLPCDGVKALDLWNAIEEAGHVIPSLYGELKAAAGAEAIEIFQAAILAREIHVRGLTHVHAHFASTATTVANLAARFAGIPYTFTAHAKDIFHESVRTDSLHRKIGEAKTVVTVSDFNLRFLLSEYASTSGHVERIYNGLDLKQFAFAPPKNRLCRIISVGRLVEKKGFGDLIDACALLRTAGLDFSCVIVGTGPLECELNAQIERLGLGDVVQLSGPRPQNEVMQLVQQSSVFAAPCIVGEDGNRDGLPTVLLEAMALGTPCVATNVTGIPEVIRHNHTGLLIPQRDVMALSNALKRLLASPQLAATLAHRARNLVEREFDIELNAAKQREFFFSKSISGALQEVA